MDKLCCSVQPAGTWMHPAPAALLRCVKQPLGGGKVLTVSRSWWMCDLYISKMASSRTCGGSSAVQGHRDGTGGGGAAS